MKKIKILYTIPNFDTAGSGILLQKIIMQLDREIFEPHICCFHNRGHFFKTIEELNLPIHIFQYTAPMKPRLKGLMKAWRISRFFKKHHFDIIFSFHYSSDYSEALAAKLAGSKWMYIKKNMSWKGPSYNSWRLRTWLADGIIAQNRDMIKMFFPKQKKVTMIPSGVDIKEFFPREKANYLLEEFHINEDARVVMTVANLVPVKGIETLIDSFAHTVDLYKKNELFLFIVGDHNSKYGRFLIEKSKNSGTKSIIFTGKRKDINQFQSIADIFVIPTLNKGRQEGSPVALLEAMASGTYVLASDVAGIRDQLSILPEQLFEAENEEELTLKMLQILNLSSSEYKKVIEKQSKIIHEYYTMAHIGRQYQEVYFKVFGKRGSSPKK